MSAAQLEFPLSCGISAESQGEYFRALLKEIVASIGLKEVAFALDVAPSYLANALQARKRHHVKIEWLPWLLSHAPDTEALRWLAELCGQDISPMKPADPVEELAAVKGVLAEILPPDMRAGITARVRARLAEKNR